MIIVKMDMLVHVRSVKVNTINCGTCLKKKHKQASIWKKEVKSMMNDLYEAFLNKYDIFSEDAESDDTEMTPEKWEKILRIMRMSEQLEDVSFLKGIE
jgi:hypothetical protein